MKFAKLFERDDEQVLVVKRYDAGIDVTCMDVVFYHDVMNFKTSFEFDGDKQEELFQKAFDKISEEEAFDLRDKLVQSKTLSREFNSLLTYQKK